VANRAEEDIAEPLVPLAALSLGALAAHVQRHESADFCAQHLGVERLRDVVDGAELVAAAAMFGPVVHSGEEDDGNLACSRALAHERRRLIAVEAWHIDVHEDEDEVMHADQVQRFRSGRRRTRKAKRPRRRRSGLPCSGARLLGGTNGRCTDQVRGVRGLCDLTGPDTGKTIV
jgi:hypothetical protein